jgi:DNA adenine methylase
VPLLLSLLPPHDTYVEVFGGAGSLLFSKPAAAVEVYNDLDSALVTFFRVLRNPRQAARLRTLLDLTPYSREELAACRAWDTATSPTERARRWFICLQQSFAGRVDAGAGWRFTKLPSHNPAQSYRGSIARLPAFTARLAHVLVEHQDFARVLRLYDTPATLFYCDPPYLPETRASHGYPCDMTLEDHTRLLDLVRGLRGMVMLSGYRSALYDGALAGWHRVDKRTLNMAANTRRDARMECIWLSPNATAHQPQLPFGDDQEAGESA